MKHEVMLGKLVLAEELLSGVGGQPGEPIRESLEHVIAVVRALVESAQHAMAGPQARES